MRTQVTEIRSFLISPAILTMQHSEINVTGIMLHDTRFHSEALPECPAHLNVLRCRVLLSCCWGRRWQQWWPSP